MKSCVIRLPIFVAPFRMAVAPSGGPCGELCLTHEVFTCSQIMLSSCRQEQSPADAGYTTLSARDILVLRVGRVGGRASREERRVWGGGNETPQRDGAIVSIP